MRRPGSLGISVARNATLTRRASKHSRLRAVVVEWSRARKRYERQGVLVEAEAIEKAEAECFEDAERRERQRDRRRTRETEIDHRFVAEFARQIRRYFPASPAQEAKKIAEHACRKYSGRIGRSAAAKGFDPTAIRLAVAASVGIDLRIMTSCCMRLRSSGGPSHGPPGGRSVAGKLEQGNIQKNRNRGRRLVTQQLCFSFDGG